MLNLQMENSGRVGMANDVEQSQYFVSYDLRVAVGDELISMNAMFLDQSRQIHTDPQ